MIECKGLTKWYGEYLALDQLDLELGKGDLFGFIGPNGAGKTTTMKILATLLLPSEGSARVAGFDVVEEPDAVRHVVGYMPDFFGVYPEMRVAEYLAFFAAAYRVPAKERTRVVGDLLELVDLAERAESLVGSLSRGMQQRLGLARALVHDPAVLILDEPASGLDPRARVEMREVLLELQRMGKTLILSSHILPELAGICNRVGIISQGRLQAHGSIEDVSAQVAPNRIVLALREMTPQADDEPVQTRVATLLQTQFGDRVERVETHREEILITPASDDALRAEDVAALVVQHGFALRTLREETPSLEDVFLALTETTRFDHQGTSS